jgi:asparagine synthase (glutamine-hydrolysing)
MSGIVGVVGTQRQAASGGESSLTPMLAGLRKRGVAKTDWLISQNAAFGCRQTLTESLREQGGPLVSPDGRWGIVVDGSIDNHAEILSQLNRPQLTSRGESTAETILQAWLAWGVSTPLKLRGAFAFFVIDFQSQRWWLVRDHCGSRPLFYAQLNAEFVFASSLEALKSHPAFEVQFNHLAIRHYLSTLRLHFDDQTLLQGVYNVRPGEIVVGSAAGRYCQKYWPPAVSGSAASGPVGSEMFQLNYDQAVESLEEILVEAVDAGRRTTSSGSVTAAPGTSQRWGILLDGELDSGLLARLAADSLAAGQDWTQCVPQASLNHQEFLDRWQSMVADQSLPLSSPNDVYYFAAAESLRGSVDQLLVSEGMNEYFYGSAIPFWAGMDYDRAAKLVNWQQTEGADVRGSLIRQYGRDRFFSPADHFLSVNGLIPRASLVSLYRPEIWGLADADRGVERHYDRLLQTGDRESMAQAQARVLADLNLENRLLRLDRAVTENGIHWRAPFTGRRVLDFAARLPYHFKIDLNPREPQPWLSSADLQSRGSLQSKRIIKSVARRWLAGELNQAPPQTATRKALHQCQHEWLPWIEQRLQSSSFARETFQPEALQAIVRQPGAGALWCWPVVNLVMWADELGSR